jgi:membrane-associated protease RseP (regulator of RpoE activity)
MTKTANLIVLAATLLLVGCSAPVAGHTAVAAISKDGFARDPDAVRQLAGQEVALWGYVDHGNLYGDEGARQILGEWWSGEGPDVETWRFNLKARADDDVGHSFPVRVPDDAGRDDLLRILVADARAQTPTKVFVRGRLFTFDAPTNVTARTGLSMALATSRDIVLEAPKMGDKMPMQPAKPAYVIDLEAAYGAPSQAGRGSAVFYQPLAAVDGLTAAALAKYKYFVGKLWDQWGEDAWMGPWKEVYVRPTGARAAIVAELRGIDDPDAALSAPMILDAVQGAEAARAALAAAYDDPAVTELRVFNLGDGGAMSGILVAGHRAGTGEATFLLFLLD